jgi:polysaccharide deacetylase 2 family uncharacterized protein YibQ
VKISHGAARVIGRGVGRSALLMALAALAALVFSGCSKPLRWPWAAKSRKTHRERGRVESTTRGARLAIIIDDLGNDPDEIKSVLALPFPITASVLPHLEYSAQTADEAWRRGDQVMLHLPMQPIDDGATAESIELRPGMSESQVRSALAGMLATVPHAIGVNNHEGSRATADPRLMTELMPLLRERRLFFIDSRTTAATVAYDEAKRAGVRAASRKVFLDDTPTRNAVLAQMDLAARDAMHEKYAIAIGHPHPGTIAALREGVPGLERRGIRIVFASELAH